MNFKNLINMFKQTWTYLSVALIVAIILRYKFGPEFIDLFGLIIFGGLAFLGLYELSSKRQMPNWIAFSLLVIGIFGIIIDGWTSFQLIKSWVFSIIGI